MPSPCEFRLSVELDAPIERVFAFHENPYNISSIAPNWQRVEVKSGAPRARADEGFVISVRFFGVLPMHWRGIWREVKIPTRLVDEALRSPFVYWKHRHEFEPLANGRTRMTDHVSYLFPGGRWGKWFGETLGRIQFRLMFIDRHARTQRWMREHLEP